MRDGQPGLVRKAANPDPFRPKFIDLARGGVILFVVPCLTSVDLDKFCPTWFLPHHAGFFLRPFCRTNSMNEDMLSVIEAAKQLERRKQTIFKVMNRLGIQRHKRRDTSSKNQLVSYLTYADFLRVKDALDKSVIDKGKDTERGSWDEFISAEIGVFYLIQLEPNHDPFRVKVGFSANMNDRLRTLRCSAPFATIIKSWPCRQLWEKTAIDCVTLNCERLHTEVFRCRSVDAAIARCDQFFGLMPPID